MKPDKKEQAIKLRKEQALSLKEIATQLGVAPSSVSLWVKDVELTPEQHELLKQKNPLYNRQLASQKKVKEAALKLRKEYQLEGRQKTKLKENQELFTKGCMLYWAEGAKCRNSVMFSNTDTEMMILFIEFLRKCFKVPDNKFRIKINCHTNNGKSKEEIENYWLNKLSLNRSNLNKTTINTLSSSSHGYKKNKHIYGVCSLYVNNSRCVQNIFGAIKEFANIDDDRWLF